MGKSQKEGQEDQGEVKELGWIPATGLRSLGPPGWLALDSLAIHRAFTTHEATLMSKPGLKQASTQAGLDRPDQDQSSGLDRAYIRTL